MIHGPQGGWHILASIRTHGMMDIVEVHYTIEHLDTGTFVSDNIYRLAVVSEGECTGYYPGLYGYLSVRELYDGDLDTPPELLGGDTLRIRLRVTDCTTSMEEQGFCVQANRWAEAALDVTALLDPLIRCLILMTIQPIRDPYVWCGFIYDALFGFFNYCGEFSALDLF